MPKTGDYGVAMSAASPSIDLRRRRFGAVTARVLDAAQQRGLTTEEIERRTGVGNTTFYRWKNGNWSKDPRATQVKKFFSELGGDPAVAEAFRALGWSEDGGREPEPIMDDPDVRAVMRALTDPNVHPAVKLMIRRQLRSMAQDVTRTDDE